MKKIAIFNVGGALSSYLEFDDYKGSLISTALNLEYRFVDHIGVGVGFNSNQIYIEMDDDQIERKYIMFKHIKKNQSKLFS